jgi:CRP-like cAMP-binding protein
MTVRPSDLHRIPLFHGITENHLAELLRACERLTLPAGHVLFEAGSEPSHLLLLVSGEVSLYEPGSPAEPRFRLSPIAPIGELGAVTGLRRNTRAETTQPSEILSVGVVELRQFFENHGDVAFPFYHNLLNIVTDKVRRDERRLEETRANLIRSQKGMKRLLQLVLESEETPLSKTICETLEDLIEHNRRIHYLVAPPEPLASSVRLDGGSRVAVTEISDNLMRLEPIPGQAPARGSSFSAVLITPGGEVPVIGKVEESGPQGTLVRLDLFIDQYAAVLRDYLTRVQMLDFVV